MAADPVVPDPFPHPLGTLLVRFRCLRCDNGKGIAVTEWGAKPDITVLEGRPCPDHGAVGVGLRALAGPDHAAAVELLRTKAMEAFHRSEHLGRLLAQLDPDAS